MFGTHLTLQGAIQTITGNLGSKFVHCTVRPPHGGALPPAGEYHILHPASDPIYGVVALMVPAGGVASSSAPTMLKPWSPSGGPAMLKPWSPSGGPAMLKPWSPSGSPAMLKPWSPSGSPAMLKPWSPSGSPAVLKPWNASPTSGGLVFVLSDKSVLGRNSIIVSSGFADLMAALQASGGATVMVV